MRVLCYALVYSTLILLVHLGSVTSFVIGSHNGRSSTGVRQKAAAQLLEFEEPQTGVKVVLVGAMHYNPASIELAKETISRLGEEQTRIRRHRIMRY